MTARERHSLADTAIDSVLQVTHPPFRFVYLDVQSPAWLRTRLAERAAAGEIEVVRFDEPLWPQEARLRITDSIDTDYVVFLDNDVQVAAGWLDALVRCADETGAGVVGPLYLWGDGVKPPTIHMAGGVISELSAAGGRVLVERHHLAGADPRTEAAGLARRPCDYVEFHCMLVRTSLLRGDPVLDTRLRCVTSISMYRSPQRRAATRPCSSPRTGHYLAFAGYRLDELASSARWSPRGGANIARSPASGTSSTARSFGDVRTFLAMHVARSIRCVRRPQRRGRR